MSDPAAPSHPDAAIARELRLRQPPAGVVRLSRRALAVSAGIAALLIGGVVVWSLDRHEPKRGVTRDARPAAADKPAPEAVIALPKDYASLPPGTPKLGPPLPGDLGRPFLAAGLDGSPVRAASPRYEATRDAARQAQVQARASRLIAVSGEAGSAQMGPPAPAADAPMLSRPAERASRAGKGELHQLSPGTSIRAALLSAVRSDLPGPVLGQVTEDVLDSATGHVLLVPRGSRLIGAYDTKVAFGQDRLFLAWSQLVLPDGRIVELQEAPATDGAGHVGLQDRVDHHWRDLLAASVVSLGFSAASAFGRRDDESDLLQALRTGALDTTREAGAQLVGRGLSMRPTLTIRSGYTLRVLLPKGLSLPAWRGAEA